MHSATFHPLTPALSPSTGEREIPGGHAVCVSPSPPSLGAPESLPGKEKAQTPAGCRRSQGRKDAVEFFAKDLSNGTCTQQGFIEADAVHQPVIPSGTARRFSLSPGKR